jgi:hypothetical protein
VQHDGACGDALSHALIFRPGRAQSDGHSASRKLRQRSLPCGPGVSIEKKFVPAGDCMAAMSHRAGTEGAEPFHLRITCAILAKCGDDFIRQ